MLRSYPFQLLFSIFCSNFKFEDHFKRRHFAFPLPKRSWHIFTISCLNQKGKLKSLKRFFIAGKLLFGRFRSLSRRSDQIWGKLSLPANICNVIGMLKFASSELSFASVDVKTSLVRNHHMKMSFDLHVHFHANPTHFYWKIFAPGLVLKQTQKGKLGMAYFLIFANIEKCVEILQRFINTEIACFITCFGFERNWKTGKSIHAPENQKPKPRHRQMTT